MDDIFLRVFIRILEYRRRKIRELCDRPVPLLSRDKLLAQTSDLLILSRATFCRRTEKKKYFQNLGV